MPSAASKCRFLSERVAREGRALGALCDFHAHSFRIRSRQSRRPQHRILAEHFAVQLGYKIVLAIGIVAPDLPELNGFDRHWFFLKRDHPACRKRQAQFRLPTRCICVNYARWFGATRKDNFLLLTLTFNRKEHSCLVASFPANPQRPDARTARQALGHGRTKLR